MGNLPLGQNKKAMKLMPTMYAQIKLLLNVCIARTTMKLWVFIYLAIFLLHPYILKGALFIFLSP